MSWAPRVAHARRPWWDALRRVPLFFCALLAATGALAGDWREADIRQSRTEARACAIDGDPGSLVRSDLVLAVLAGGQDLRLLEAGSLTPRARCQLPQALQGTPLRSPDGRYLYLATDAGWLLRIDLQQVAGPALQVRTGLQLTGLALSADGQWLLAGHAEPHDLVLLDAQLAPVRLYRTATLDGRRSSAVSGVWHAPARKSFLVGLRELPEIWELSYDPAAAPIYDGLVHDYRMAEAIASAGFLGVRRTLLEQAVQIVRGDATLRHLLVIPAARTDPALDVINMDIRRRTVSRRLPAWPLASGAAFDNGKRHWLALLTRDEGAVLLLDSQTWQLHPELLPPLRDVVAIRAHPAAPHLWLQHARGDRLTLLDTADLRRGTPLRTAGSPWVDLAFSAGGRQVVLATAGAQGDLSVRDSRTLQELQRVPLPQVQAVYGLDAPDAP